MCSQCFTTALKQVHSAFWSIILTDIKHYRHDISWILCSNVLQNLLTSNKLVGRTAHSPSGCQGQIIYGTHPDLLPLSSPACTLCSLFASLVEFQNAAMFLNRIPTLHFCKCVAHQQCLQSKKKKSSNINVGSFQQHQKPLGCEVLVLRNEALTGPCSLGHTSSLYTRKCVIHH